MWIKQFRAHEMRVNDPLRPGRKTFEERLVESGCTSVSDAGKTYEAEEDGWIEVPDELGERLVNFRMPGGERFFQPHDVNELNRLGVLYEQEEELAAVAQPRAKTAAPVKLPKKISAKRK